MGAGIRHVLNEHGGVRFIEIRQPCSSHSDLMPSEPDYHLAMPPLPIQELIHRMVARVGQSFGEVGLQATFGPHIDECWSMLAINPTKIGPMLTKLVPSRPVATIKQVWGQRSGATSLAGNCSVTFGRSFFADTLGLSKASDVLK